MKTYLRKYLALTTLTLLATTACDRSQATVGNSSRSDRTSHARAVAQPKVKVIALSPVLPIDAKTVAGEIIDAEFERLAQSAPEGATVYVIDADACRPIATLRAVHGAARIRKRALTPQMTKVRAFLEKANPQVVRDGRLRFTQFCELLAQAHLPPGTPVVVLGNPLFLNDGADAVFSMHAGAVPSDGMLFVDRKFSLYSIVGRERALAGLLIYWGYPSAAVFVDDSHKQRVQEFWSGYLKCLGATLVISQPSLASAGDAASQGLSKPMLTYDPDPRAKPEMVRIEKVIRNETSNHSVPKSDDEKIVPARHEVENLRSRNTKGGAALDVHGNPIGDAHDLIHARQMSGKRIVLVTFDHYPDIEASPLPDAMRKKGFEVERVRYPLPQLAAWKVMLKSADQVWLISSEETDHFPKSHRAALLERWNVGMGLYLSGDNHPFFQEANAALASIAPGARLSGNYPGLSKLSVAQGGGPGFVAGPLFHGIVSFFEGNTVSEIVLGGGFKAACRHSGGGVLLATLDDGKRGRVVVDGGYTRWFANYFDQAGASRLAVNIAGWLAGIDGEN